MFTPRIQERVPSVSLLGIGQLRGHTLKWHKRGKDGSGKCDAEATMGNSDIVWGVLFNLGASEKFILDKYEGLGRGYDEKEVEILTTTSIVKALMYYAIDKDPSLLPYDWYKEYVVNGAREHGFPKEYIARLEKIPSIPTSPSSKSDFV